MFDWFKKKAPVIIPEQEESYFSTEISPNRRLVSKLDVISDIASHHKLARVGGDGTTGMDDANNSVMFKGGLSNWDGAISDVQFNYFAGQSFIGFQIAAILSQHWLIDKACAMPARDAARHGYLVMRDDGEEIKPEVMSTIRKADKYFKVKQNCVELVHQGRVFGIRIAMFEVDGIDYEKPFNIDGVKPGSYKGISQVDPYWVSPQFDSDSAQNSASRNFYNPTWWQINGRKIHRSHLVVYRTGHLPDFLKPAYQYAGVPLPQRIAERVYAAERTANEAPLLALTKRTDAIHLDVKKALANQAAFEDRMNAWVAYRDNYGVKILGTDEVMERFDTSLTDFDSTIMTQYQLVAAIAGCPATKLIETSPKGFDATGEFEQKSYRENLETIQENDMSPLVERHHQLLMRSEILPKFKEDFEIVSAWQTPDAPTAKEIAEINSLKSTTAKNYSDIGAVDGTDVRQTLISDKDSGYTGLDAIVPGGPGDREAEQEAEQQQLQAKKSSDNEG